MGIKLAWDDQSTSQLDAIEIYRGTSPIELTSPGTPLVSLPPSATQYEDMTVKNKSLYYYRIAGVKGTERGFGENQLAGYFSETGPGREYPIRGDWNAGFMDYISSTQFITGADLMAKLPGFVYGSVGSPSLWWKMCYQGKVLYLPNSAVVSASWNELYNAGLIYGTDDFGNSPAGVPGSVNQKRIVDINGLQYLVRCARFSNNPLNQYLTDQDDTLESEWRNTFSRLVLPSVYGAITGEKARLSDASSLPLMYSQHHNSPTTVTTTSTSNPAQLGILNKTGRYTVGLILELIMP